MPGLFQNKFQNVSAKLIETMSAEINIKQICQMFNMSAYFISVYSKWNMIKGTIQPNLKTLSLSSTLMESQVKFLTLQNISDEVCANALAATVKDLALNKV